MEKFLAYIIFPTEINFALLGYLGNSRVVDSRISDVSISIRLLDFLKNIIVYSSSYREYTIIIVQSIEITLLNLSFKMFVFHSSHNLLTCFFTHMSIIIFSFSHEFQSHNIEHQLSRPIPTIIIMILILIFILHLKYIRGLTFKRVRIF